MNKQELCTILSNAGVAFPSTATVVQLKRLMANLRSTTMDGIEIINPSEDDNDSDIQPDLHGTMTGCGSLNPNIQINIPENGGQHNTDMTNGNPDVLKLNKEIEILKLKMEIMKMDTACNQQNMSKQ